MKVILSIYKSIKDMIFPNICICGKWGKAICEDCYNKIAKNKKDLCPICGSLSNYGKTCSKCSHKSKLTGVMIFGKHEGLLKDSLWNYKYEFYKDLSVPFAKLLFEKYGSFIQKKNFIITFVPISTNRKRWRGFNQSELLASELSKFSSLQSLELFIKDETIPQVGLKKKERIKNIKNKIHYKTSNNIKSAKILIVDDVYTTGSTLEECANILRVHGAKEVWGIVLTRD